METTAILNNSETERKNNLKDVFETFVAIKAMATWLDLNDFYSFSIDRHWALSLYGDMTNEKIKKLAELFEFKPDSNGYLCANKDLNGICCHIILT